MARSFPHLGDTAYPGGGDDLYPAHDNRFDYDRWLEGTRLYPMTVRWTVDGEDRVWWHDDATRDAWFDARKNDAFDLPAAMDVLPGGTVKLPIPAQAITCANYLLVELPDMPGEGAPLDHSTTYVKRWHYFIESARRVTPSVTECTLVVDWFTTFQHAMQVARIDLKRGHYPMTLTNVTDYLADPLAHTEGLTGTEPFQPTGARRTVKTDMVPLGDGEAYAVFAVKTTADRADNTIPDAQVITGEAPGYASTADYWGADWQVSGYRYGGARDLAGSRAPRTPMAMTNDGLRPNGYTLLALKATDLDAAVRIWEEHPLVLRMIDACMIVPADMLTLGKTVSFGGVTCNTAVTVRDKRLTDIKLARDDFRYPRRYADVTKLYTSPYAELELTDENGDVTTVRIEDTTATTGIRRFLTLAYPTLQALTFLTDVNGTGDVIVTWGTMTGTAATGMPNGMTALSTHDIPTYTLWLDPVEAWNLDNHAKTTLQARDNAVNAYHNGVRGTNTGQTNTNASADTGQTNANASADTGQTNANASADTGQTNANAMATVSENNAKNATATATANTKLQTDNANANLGIANTLRGDLQDNSYLTNTDVHETNRTMAYALQEADAKAVAMTTLQGAVGDIAGGAANGGAAGAIGGVTAGISSAISSAIALNATAEKTDATLLAESERIRKNGSGSQATVDYTNKANTAIVGNNNKVATQTTTNNNNLNTTNTGNTATVTRSNATRTATTAKANATRTATTAKANAARTATTAKANAQRSRDATVNAAQIALTQAQAQYNAALNDLRRAAPLQLAAPSGDAAPDMLGTRGVQVRVKTQSPDVIRRCGDQMLRYGYTYDCVIEEPDFTLNRKFTYWQGTPLVYSTGMAPAQAVESVRAIFEAGVTIWADGDTIGASIYDTEA